MKRILFLIILIFAFFSLNRTDINDVTFVKTIGISENDGHVEMILNTIVPEKGLDTSTYQIQSIVLEGHDVGEMLNSFLSEHYQHVSFDQLELLLLDDDSEFFPVSRASYEPIRSFKLLCWIGERCRYRRTFIQSRYFSCHRKKVKKHALYNEKYFSFLF